MNRRSVAVAIAIAVLGMLTGCGGSTHAATTPSTSVTRTASPTPTPTPLTPTAPATTPLGAGQRVWAAFSASTLAYDAWWAQLKPMLSEAARAVYVYDDPHNLPSMTLTGPLHVATKAPGEPRYTAEVLVPTSKGTFALDLERATLTSAWLLFAIRFPSGVQ